MGAVHLHHAIALRQHYANFVDAIDGIETVADKRRFAHLVLSRLLLAYDLQVAGYLNDGDRWYLHSQLGKGTFTAPKTFLKTFFQPFCHQGLALPPWERPRSLQEQLGNAPCLGGQPFQAHALEQRYPNANIADEAIERFLGWLAEQTWWRDEADDSACQSDTLSVASLAVAYEYLITATTGKAQALSSDVIDKILHQTVDAHILRDLNQQLALEAYSLEAIGENLSDDVCWQLVNVTLPRMTILDPACGSGRFLLAALERLQWLYRACLKHAQVTAHEGLQDWWRSLIQVSKPPLWTLTCQLITQNLHGVDLLPEAVTATQTQLWLRLLATVPPKKALPILPSLDFNITQGNSLVGFIRVDENSFDKIVPKRSPATDFGESFLQGNLLQPLAAANYRDTLAEKQIRVEHYQAQTRAMGQEGGVPEYVQTEFLRDRIDAVNQAAQHKLNGLLFEILSRKLGIRASEPQPSGRSRKRVLMMMDIEALQPFHWGFFFNRIIEQEGGFDVIFTQAPEGTLSPRAKLFFEQHEEKFQSLNIDLKTFQRSRRSTLQNAPELAKLWAVYAGKIACQKDYVRRSDDYPRMAEASIQRAIAYKTLFVQRCDALRKAGSVDPAIL